jgi:membrane fusion protein, heavy metal efflux system
LRHNQQLIRRLLTLAGAVLFCLQPASVQAQPLQSAGIEPTGPWGDTITISQLGKAAIGLQTATVARKPLARSISTTGKIQSLPTREFDQEAVLVGRVLQMLVNIGDSVQVGQTLAILDSPEINQLAAETLQNKTQLETEISQVTTELDAEIEQNRASNELADINYKRNKKLFEEGIGALKDVQLSLADSRLATSRLRAAELKKEITLKGLQSKLKVSSSSLRLRLRQLGVPERSVEHMLAQQQTILHVPVTASRSGVITAIQTSVGQSVNQSTPMFSISDLSKVWAVADIYEDDMSSIRLGQKVTVRVSALPQNTFTGKITFIGKTVNALSRTLPVGVEITNPGLQLKPDMFANLSIETTEPTLSIIVPRDAVVERNGHYLVFVESQGGYQTTRVKVGRRFGDDIEILEGLSAGQKIVIHGAFQLSAELLKSQGHADLFAQPTQGDHKEHSLDANADERNRGPGAQVIVILIAAAFFLGFLLSLLIMRGGRSKTPSGIPADSESLSKR